MKNDVLIEPKKALPAATARQLEWRARDAVSQLLSQRLLLPMIFFEAAWEPTYRADVLAIDRTGAGDVHVIEIKTTLSSSALRLGVRRLFAAKANYLWLAVVHRLEDAIPLSTISALANPKGMGRIGLIDVVANFSDTLTAKVIVEAERFSGSFYDRADRFVAKTKPDLQFR